jgi:hypothetical protein
MAIYDTDATSSTAITAWLAQFKVASTGAITYVSGTDTFHVKWINRALQKIAWDFIISGDDEVNLSFPNPSKEEALGKIITLNDWTTDYSVNYTVTDTVMQYHFGGSVSQNGGADEYYGLQVLGQTSTPLPLKIIQNEVELTSHWGNGKNQTDSNTLLRVMVKGRSAGSDIDGRRVVVKASTWFETYALWETTLALGESVASITTGADPQNDTALVTVQAYGITKSEGYNLLDLDGAGNKPYLGEWSYAGAGAGTKKSLYEFVKAILVDGTTDTLYGVDGDLWTGRVYDCVITTPRSGTWVQNETISWGAGATAGNGNLMGVDTLTGGSTVRLILHLGAGVPPAAAATITGNGGAIGTVSGTPVKITTKPEHLAQFTGAWIGAYGIGFAAGEIGSADSFIDLDGNPVTPPNNVTVSGTIEALNAADDLHVFLAKKDAVLNAPDYTVYTAVGEIIGAGVIRTNTAIASDTPQTGWVGVLKTGTTTYKFYEYSSWSGTTFTLVGTVAGDAITASDPIFTAIMYDSMTGGGTTKTFSNTLIYSGDFAVVGWVRHGDASGVDKIIPISGTVGAAGFTFSGTMEAEV